MLFVHLKFTRSISTGVLLVWKVDACMQLPTEEMLSRKLLDACMQSPIDTMGNLTFAVCTFAVCQRHTAKAGSCTAKLLPCVTHGKVPTAYIGRQRACSKKLL